MSHVMRKYSLKYALDETERLARRVLCNFHAISTNDFTIYFPNKVGIGELLDEEAYMRNWHILASSLRSFDDFCVVSLGDRSQDRSVERVSFDAQLTGRIQRLFWPLFNSCFGRYHFVNRPGIFDGQGVSERLLFGQPYNT